MVVISIMSDSGFQFDIKDTLTSAKTVIGRHVFFIPSFIVPVIRTRVYADRISRGFVGDSVGDNGPSGTHARIRAVSLPIV